LDGKFKNEMKISGVYKIQSKAKPERIYIGSSVDVISRRMHVEYLAKHQTTNK